MMGAFVGIAIVVAMVVGSAAIIFFVVRRMGMKVKAWQEFATARGLSSRIVKDPHSGYRSAHIQGTLDGVAVVMEEVAAARYEDPNTFMATGDASAPADQGAAEAVAVPFRCGVTCQGNRVIVVSQHIPSSAAELESVSRVLAAAFGGAPREAELRGAASGLR